MLAASAGHIEAFTILLKKNSAIDAVDKERQTVLHLAARENHMCILKVYISKEAAYAIMFITTELQVKFYLENQLCVSIFCTILP